MVQEEKDLLLKDLSARFPYGVKCIVTKSRTEEGQRGDVGKITCICLEGVDCIGSNYHFFSEFGNFKLYLFPLSSMTEKQKKEYESLCIKETSECTDLYGIIFTEDYYYDTVESIDYLYKNHIDIRGLISKGLAIDATGLNIY